MMKKNLSTNKILNQLEFSLKEKEVFDNCILIAKNAQNNETINVEIEFEKLIERMNEDEV